MNSPWPCLSGGAFLWAFLFVNGFQLPECPPGMRYCGHPMRPETKNRMKYYFWVFALMAFIALIKFVEWHELFRR